MSNKIMATFNLFCRKFLYFPLILALFMAFFFTVNSCTPKNEKKGSPQNSEKTHQEIQPAANQSNDSQDNEHKHGKELWTCPMHPQIIKEAPGTCPICGMDLVKLENIEEQKDQSQAHTPQGHASFKLSQMRSQMIGVQYGKVKKKTLYKSIEAAGKVAFDPELYTAQNEYIEAIKQLERVKNSPIADVKHSAQKMLESAKLRLKILGLSDKEIHRLQNSTPQASSNLLITSPGQSVWIYAEVFEMDLKNIEAGHQVKITGGPLEGKELLGKVASVDRVINPTTRTAKVRILVPDAKAFLRPESFVNVSILSPLGEQLVIPLDAVLDSGKEAWVFVAKEKGEFEPRTVLIKHYAGDEVSISSGLEEGEEIVISANFLIDSESRLKGVLQSQRDESEPTQKSKDQTAEESEKSENDKGHSSDSKSSSNLKSSTKSPSKSSSRKEQASPSTSKKNSPSIDNAQSVNAQSVNEQSNNEQSSAENDDVEPPSSKNLPQCPKGQFWHEQMKHCMDKVGDE